MTKKECFKCGAEKPLTEFHKHPQMPDGRVNKCKVCNNLDVRENRARNVEYYRQYDNDRYKNDPERRAKFADRAKVWRERHPDRYKAHGMVSNAVRDGRLIKEPCEVCGAEYVHGHHDDYSKPLDVRWLCPIHHKEHHDNETNQKELTK